MNLAFDQPNILYSAIISSCLDMCSMMKIWGIMSPASKHEAHD